MPNPSIEQLTATAFHWNTMNNDEFGFSGIDERVSVHDIHASTLHLMSFDHENFTYDFQGRPF